MTINGNDLVKKSAALRQTFGWLMTGIIIMILTLGFYKRADLSWGGRSFEVWASKVTLVPVPWFTCTEVHSKGNSPPMEYMPDGNLYSPGMSVDWKWAGICLIASWAIGFALYRIARGRLAPLLRPHPIWAKIMMIALVPVAVVLGATLPLVSVPIGFALVIALLMIPLLILAWTTRGYACTILLVSAVSCLCFWGFRIGDFFRAFKFFNDVEFLQDFVAPALYAGVFLVPSLLVVKLSRFLNARKMLRLAQSSD